MKKWINDNDVFSYQNYNEGKPVIAERFIRILKNKIYNEMTTNASSFYLDHIEVSDEECNVTYHRSIGKKSVDANHYALP